MSAAERNKERPGAKVKVLMQEVKDVAAQTQSEAFHFHEFDDGTILEVRCAPEPSFRGDLPEPGPEHEGKLSVSSGDLLRCRAKVSITTDIRRHLEGARDASEALQRATKELRDQDDGATRREVRRVSETEFGLVEFEWSPSQAQYRDESLTGASVKLNTHDRR